MSATFETSVGVHDFIVSDIKTDGVPAHIKDGTSHTLGLNVGFWVKHTTPSHINILAKAEAFLDNDKDELDKDHLPIWFDFLLDIDGPVHTVDEHNAFKWYIYLDNKQNTVSCIEREVRQHVGIGYTYTNKGFSTSINGYLGFYYIEIDDDTPSDRGYTRSQTDDGEASNVFEIEAKYIFNDHWWIYANFKHFAANTGAEVLEDNANLHIVYEKAGFLTEGTSLNLKVKYVKYNLERFQEEHTLSILPWDNETLLQAYVTIPLKF